MKWIPYHNYIFFLLLLASCNKSGEPATTPDPEPPPPAPFHIDQITDTYAPLADFSKHAQWGPYNTHDPSLLKVGDTWYSYSTDAAYGIAVKPGVQIRKSKDLVDWQFVGWAFDQLPPQGAAYIRQQGAEPFQSLWAPFILKYGDEFRLYYSLSSPIHKLSVIGMATASQPGGPFTEKGLAVVSAEQLSMTNAIDPSIITDFSGKQWMYYGSAYDGIYVLELNPETGLAKQQGDKGKRIAQRGFTNGNINGNIEAPEIIYHPGLQKYFLFVSYDWLETKYNVIVGRSDHPDGPFLDFNGKNLNTSEDNVPMILAPYRFADHGGWQGTAHCSVVKENGQYYMAHQGRPGVDKYFMVMHIRKIFFTKSGWPVVSPQRFANIAQGAISSSEIAGNWEQIILGYRVVPGYANEQTNADMQTSVSITLDANGTINGNAANTWKYEAPHLTLNWGTEWKDELIVSRERDWEKKKNTLIFTGLNNAGTAIWGKKK